MPTGNRKTKKTVVIDQKHIVFYSEKYAKRSKIKREQTLAKASDLIANPSKYKRASAYGAAGYVKNIKFDKATGEIIDIAVGHLFAAVFLQNLRYAAFLVG